MLRSSRIFKELVYKSHLNEGESALGVGDSFNRHHKDSSRPSLSDPRRSRAADSAFGGQGKEYKYSKESQPKAEEWYWVWSCHQCLMASDMSAEICVACVECNHMRCEDCPIEAIKKRRGR